MTRKMIAPGIRNRRSAGPKRECHHLLDGTPHTRRLQSRPLHGRPFRGRQFECRLRLGHLVL